MSSNKIKRHSSKRRFTYYLLFDQINWKKLKVLKAKYSKCFHYQRSLKVSKLVRIVLICTVVTHNSSCMRRCRGKTPTTTSCLQLRIQNQSDLQFKVHTLRCFKTLIWAILRQPMQSGNIKFRKNKRNIIRQLTLHEAGSLS